MENREIQKYNRHSTASIELVLSYIKLALEIPNPYPNRNPKIKAIINGLNVGVSSLRLRTFLEKGTECVQCGLKATHFALERGITDGKHISYHLNLWGADAEGTEVLFTHDHTLARGLGGKDSIDNTQTMCCHCNWAKGEMEGIQARKASVLF